MRKLILSVLLTITCLLTYAGSFNYYRVQNAGGTVTVTAAGIPNVGYVYSSSGVTLAANYTLQYNVLPPLGTNWRVYVYFPNIDVNGHTISIYGKTLLDEEIAIGVGYLDFSVVATHSGNSLLTTFSPLQISADEVIDGSSIVDFTIAPDKLQTADTGSILIADPNGTFQSNLVTGDVTMDYTGVTSYTAGSIVNADINASAAITRSKLASGSASHVLINDGSGVMSSEAQLSTSRGGFGTSVASSTGIVSFSTGTPTIGAFTEIRDLHVSWDTTCEGTYYITAPVGYTATNIEVRIEKLIEATDSATLTLLNNTSTALTGSNLTAGVLVITAGATTGTGFTSTLTANNTFTAGERLQLVTAKGHAGGSANVQITFTRLN